MDIYQRNIETLKKCQLKRDYSEPPEYWDDNYMNDEDHPLGCECEQCGYSGILGEG